MTWAKYGTEYNDELANADLSDAAYRTHTEAIGWLYRIEETSLQIPKHLLRRFAGSIDYETAIKDLVNLGFWRDRGSTWEIVHHADVIRQSIVAQRQKRDRDKRAQQAKRNRSEGRPVSADVSAGVSGDTDSQTDSFPPAPQRDRRQ